MEDKLKKILKKPYVPYILYGLIFGAFLFLGYEMFGDDIHVRENLMPSLLDELENLSRSYTDWSSRIFINPPIWVMMHFPVWVWGCITTLLAVYIFWGIDRLLFKNEDRKDTRVLLLLLLLLPMEAFYDVGYVVTTMTYIWPLAAAICSFFSIRRFADGKRITWYHSLFLCLCTMYAANKEELSVMLFIIFGTAFIISLKAKKPNITILLQMVIAAASILFHMLSGGNTERYHFANPYNDSFFDKLEIGLTQTPLRLFLKYDYMCLAFSAILMCIIFLKYKNVLVRAVSIIPVAAWIFGAIGGLILSDGNIDVAAYDTSLFCYGLSISRGKYTHPMAWIMLFASILVMLALVYTVMKCAPDKKTALPSFLLLASAYGGRATTGFANSGWGLYARTYLFMYYVFIIIMAVYIQAVRKELSEKKETILIRCLVIFAVLGAFKNIVTLGII
ncbi:MAG: hypothetical protein NC240_00880 [Clostridium sp.]|nr:hypothetical protein [Clostridium sp.]